MQENSYLDLRKKQQQMKHENLKNETKKKRKKTK